jgi:hypothetical protein
VNSIQIDLQPAEFIQCIAVNSNNNQTKRDQEKKKDNPAADERTVVGSAVHARAKFVTAEAECKRRYGANFKTKEVDGIVLSAENKKLPGNTRKT